MEKLAEQRKRRVDLKVLQVIGDDALCFAGFHQKSGIILHSQTEPIYVEGLGKKLTLTDGVKWEGIVYQNGRYQYVAVAGGGKTIRKYTVDPTRLSNEPQPVEPTFEP